ncbi:MAG: hypothetical protein M3Y27_04945, partial [Acidobacteriota bacterium]|nr:hypothetical protein [Acidobacteriota bacterium]
MTERPWGVRVCLTQSDISRQARVPRPGPAKTFVRPRLEHPSVPDHGAPRCMDGSFRKRVAIKIVSASFLSTQSQGFA